jgi:hypothetical protein
MFSNGAAAKFPLVPSKDILILLQHSPDLLLTSIIQLSIYPDSLADLLPPMFYL